jgi:hypothetical protein
MAARAAIGCAIFLQLAGLGHIATAMYYARQSRAETMAAG